jgi:hypothetical protein
LSAASAIFKICDILEAEYVSVIRKNPAQLELLEGSGLDHSDSFKGINQVGFFHPLTLAEGSRCSF